MKSFHLIHVKYHGATNTRGSRVSLYSERFKKRISIPFDYTYNDIADMAEKKLLEFGFDIVGQGESVNGSCVIVTNTFRTLAPEGKCFYCEEGTDTTKADSHILPNGLCVYHNHMKFEPVK